MADITDAVLDGFMAALDGDGSAPIELRSESLREIGMRIVPWEVPVMTRSGPEVHLRGSLDGIDPADVVLQLEHENPPAGKGISYENRSDGAWMTFKVSATQRGDDILTLARDGVTKGVSVSFNDVPGGTEIHTRAGTSLRVVRRALLRAVSTTWRPTWKEAAIQFVRSEGGDPVPEAAPAPETPAPVVNVDTTAIADVVASLGLKMDAQSATLADMRATMLERSRGDIIVPGPGPTAPPVTRGDWATAALRLLSGERISALEMRTLDDIVTTDNVGVVPDAYLTELIGVIDPSRPFLNSTRHLPTPAAGMSFILPKIVTRPETGVQAAEKDDVASNTTSITTQSSDFITIAGGGDLSLQILKRSSPSFLSLYVELLAESYAQNTELKAIQALLAAGISSGGTLDPDDAAFGAAWRNGANVNVTPDTIWLSSEGVGAFIDAKANGTNVPLYSNISASFTAGGGPGGSISGLRPVYVPKLDTASGTVDAIVGPSRGFAWAEDGTYTLQVDVPAKAGRDVAIVGMIAFAALYPTAFTSYVIAGS